MLNTDSSLQDQDQDSLQDSDSLQVSVQDQDSLQDQDQDSLQDSDSLQVSVQVQESLQDSLQVQVPDSDSLPPVAQEQVVECGPNKLGDIFTFVSEGSFSESVPPLRKKNLKRFARKFILEDGLLFYVGVKREEKREVVLDPERKRQIFLQCHSNDVGGHLGQKKTVHRIQSRFYWLGIIRDVVHWIKVCETCRGAERSRTQTRAVRPQHVSAPWDLCTALLLGPFPASLQGSAHVLLVQDHFSKWPEAFPLQQVDPEGVARALASCVYRFGAPKTIAVTEGPDFCSEVSRCLVQKWSLALSLSSVDRDHSAPALREAVLQLVEHRHELWAEHLEQTLFELRTSVDPSTRYSPFSLLYGRAPAPSGTHSTHSSHSTHSTHSTQTLDQTCPHLRAVQEHQDVLRNKVLENMSAAYKLEKRKSLKQKSNRLKSECVFGDRSVKKRRLFLEFPAEGDKRLDFHLQTAQ